VDTTLLAKGLDEANIFLVVAVLGEAAQTGSTAIKGLGTSEMDDIS
jgi:hypothetical protein